MSDEDGFTLIEMLAVIAIVALMASLILPSLRGGSPAEIDAYAMRIAGLLKADRTAAMRAGAPVLTSLSLSDRAVTSGVQSRVVRIPATLAFDAVLAERCAGFKGARGIVFFPSGLSCGGVVVLERPGARAEIRVNWLTGGVEIVASAKP